MTWQVKDITDKAYFAYGDIFGGIDSPLDGHKELVVSNSFIKNIFKSNLFCFLQSGGTIVDEALQEIFDVGSGFHCYCLENADFEDRFHVSDYTDASKTTTQIRKSDFEFIENAYKSLETKYPNIIDQEHAELAIFGEIDGVRVKCKIDKLNITKVGNRYTKVEIIDLKSVYFDMFSFKKSPDGTRWKLRQMLSDVGYDIQAYFYTRLVEEWLLSINQHCEVTFALVVASKDTHETQKFQVGAEMFESGKMKFDSVWGDIVSFIRDGKKSLIDYEVL
ncbi:MAG: hypothetical protein GQ474_01575 [Sulfurimonas sp.]|nr:hypothetical protein [Sulfurimonas sp.]